ncbi:flagellar protein FliO/FliZ [Gammaproteobacteria bacterium]
MQLIFLAIWCLGIPFASTLAAGLATGETRPPPLLGTGELLQVSLSLGVVLAAIALTAWLLRRFTKLGGTMGGGLRVLGGVSLGGRERVVLMQVGEQQVLLGVAPGWVQTLHILEQPLSVSQPPADFALALRALVREKVQ